MIETQQFAGASKVNTSFLTPFERRLAKRVVPRIPSWLETYHLTMLTLVWSSLILLFSYFAARDLRWLWGVSAMIALQYITDHYDGKVGKYRGTGLVRWGYYMDHLLDYYFLCSVIIGYAFILPEKSRYQILILLAICSGYEITTFLAFAAMDKFKISYLKFGPTEFRLALIIINALLVQYGTRQMVGALKYVNAGGVIGLSPGARSMVRGSGRAASSATTRARTGLAASGRMKSDRRTASSGMSLSRASRASTGTR